MSEVRLKCAVCDLPLTPVRAVAEREVMAEDADYQPICSRCEVGQDFDGEAEGHEITECEVCEMDVREDERGIDGRALCVICRAREV